MEIFFNFNNSMILSALYLLFQCYKRAKVGNQFSSVYLVKGFLLARGIRNNQTTVPYGPSSK